MATPTIAQTYEIEYGSITIGGSSSDYWLMREGLGLFEGYKTARVEAQVLVFGTSTTDFRDNMTALIDQFRTPRARLQVKRPDGYEDFNPSTNSGFDAEPEIRESSDQRFNNSRMRLFNISVTVQLPADLSGQSGRRDNRLVTAYDANRRRTITMRGQYTALSSNDATAQYNASIGAYATSVLPGGATWQLISENLDRNDTDKVIDFTRQYREITLDQDGSGSDNASVVTQSLRLTKIDNGGAALARPGGRLSIPLATYRVSYDATIDIEVTANSGLEALWENTLRAYVVGLAASRLGIGPENGGAVSNETLTTDPENNVITAAFDYSALNGSLLTEARMTKEVQDDSGLVFTPVTTGAPHSYVIDEGPPSLTLTVVIEEKTAGTSFFNYTPPANYFKVRETDNQGDEFLGLGSNSIRFRRRRFTGVYRFAIPYTGGTGTVVGGRNPLKTITDPSGPGL